MSRPLAQTGFGAARKQEGALSPLELYLRQINEVPLLSAEEEKELAKKIKTGDSAARDQMIRANLKLVVNIARKYTGRGLGLQDLIEEGNLGLMRAVEGFDPEKNFRFSTYSSTWIKQKIKMAIVNHAKTIRIPAYLVELQNQFRRTERQMLAESETDTLPSFDAVCDQLNISAKRRKHLAQSFQIAAGTKVEQNDQGQDAFTFLEDTSAAQASQQMVEQDNLSYLSVVLNDLEKSAEPLHQRYAFILKARHGIGQPEGAERTLKAIGQELGLSRERVRQLEAEALQEAQARILRLEEEGLPVTPSSTDIKAAIEAPDVVPQSAQEAKGTEDAVYVSKPQAYSRRGGSPFKDPFYHTFSISV